MEVGGRRGGGGGEEGWWWGGGGRSRGCKNRSALGPLREKG